MAFKTFGDLGRWPPFGPNLLTAHSQVCCRVTWVECSKFVKASDTPSLGVAMETVGAQLSLWVCLPGCKLLSMLQLRNWLVEATLRD